MGHNDFLTGSSCDPPPPDALLAGIAGRRHGLLTTADLRWAGLNAAAVAKRRARRRLHRVGQGVYSLGHAALSQEGRWLAAVLEAGDGAALTHLSAAKLWEIWRRRVPRIDVVSPCRSRLPYVHRARSLDVRDTTTRNGIRVTTVPRTLVNLTNVLSAEQLAHVIHQAAFGNRFSLAATHQAMQRANGRRNLHRLSAALEAHSDGSAGTKSDPEDGFLAGR